MYVCMYAFVHVYVLLQLPQQQIVVPQLEVHVHLCARMHVYMCVCMHIFMYACIHTRMHACMHACVYSCFAAVVATNMQHMHENLGMFVWIHIVYMYVCMYVGE